MSQKEGGARERLGTRTAGGRGATGQYGTRGGRERAPGSGAPGAIPNTWHLECGGPSSGCKDLPLLSKVKVGSVPFGIAASWCRLRAREETS